MTPHHFPLPGLDLHTDSQSNPKSTSGVPSEVFHGKVPFPKKPLELRPRFSCQTLKIRQRSSFPMSDVSATKWTLPRTLSLPYLDSNLLSAPFVLTRVRLPRTDSYLGLVFVP